MYLDRKTMNPSINTSDKSDITLSLQEASEYLASNMNDQRTASNWKKYLKENLEGNCTKYGGYKLKCIVIDGHPCYSETTLKVFIKIMGAGVQRTSVLSTLRAVDKRSRSNENKRYKIKGVSKASKSNRSNSFM